MASDKFIYTEVIIIILKIFIFLGKIFICAFATLGGYLIITRVEKYDEALYSTFIPTLVMIIIVCINSIVNGNFNVYYWLSVYDSLWNGSGCNFALLFVG